MAQRPTDPAIQPAADRAAGHSHPVVDAEIRVEARAGQAGIAPAAGGATGSVQVIGEPAEPDQGGGSVTVVVNGEPRAVLPGHPLPDLLTDLGLRVGTVVVEYNGEALTATESRSVRLRAGDRLELVRAVAGG
jgi:sulfur carrier protein